MRRRISIPRLGRQIPACTWLGFLLVYRPFVGHVGLICPNVPGHLNPMLALADAIRRRGHRATFFLLGDVPELVAAAGIEVVPLGGSIFPPDEYRTAMQRLGTLEGRAALSHTLAMAARSAEAILGAGPAAARAVGITALLVDQASFPGGTVADELGVPFATVCNALLLNPGPAVPPFFTRWRPQDAWWARLRNRIAWAGLDRLYSPIPVRIQDRRRQLGMPVPERIAQVWSSRLQISQQPAAFEFPRQASPKQVRFVGPLRLSDGYPPVPPFPWDRLDGRRLVYASLGTLQNRIAGTFRMIAEACDGLDVQLVISTGHGVPMASSAIPRPAGRGALRATAGTAPPGGACSHSRGSEYDPRCLEHRPPDGGHPGDERATGNRRPDCLGRLWGDCHAVTGDSPAAALADQPGAVRPVLRRRCPAGP